MLGLIVKTLVNEYFTVWHFSVNKIEEKEISN